MLTFYQHMLKLGRNDARLVWRDAFLFGMLFYMLFLGAVLRFGLPALNDFLADNPSVPFALADYYPLLTAYVGVYAASLVGAMIVGFVMIDEGDQHTLNALLVTPMPLTHFLLYRVLVPIGLGVLMSLSTLYVINLALLPFWQMLLIGVGSGLVSALMMLVLAVLSDNKVQGFAIVKGLGAGGMLLFGAWFVELPLQYLFGLFPPYWVAKAYWLALANDPAWLLHLGIGCTYLGALIAVFAGVYRRKAYRLVLS